MHLQPFFLLLLLCGGVAPAPLPIDGVLRQTGDGRTYAYLVPPKGGNHAATISQLDGGALGVAWFTGGEGTPNCSIAFSALARGARAWTPGAIAAQVTNQSAQNPVLWQGARGEISLWHTVQNPSAGESSSWIWRALSHDGGATWSPPAPFFAVAGAFTRNAPLPLTDGGLLLPIYNSTPGAIPDYPIMLVSDAAGSAWAPRRAPGADLIQPSVVRVPGGSPRRLRAWLRDENQSCAYVMTSEDEGASWSEPAATELPNNNAALQALTLRSGAVAIVFDFQRGPGTPRSPLVIALSDDGGLSFPYQRVLMSHDDNSSSVGEYSYPALTQTDDLQIHLAYTVDRIAIKYESFDEAWVRSSSS